jgi:hypothetical protein
VIHKKFTPVAPQPRLSLSVNLMTLNKNHPSIQMASRSSPSFLRPQERCTLAEKLSNTQNELSNMNVEYERLKRESIGKQDQDRATITNLQGELKNFHAQFEEAT